LPRWHLCSCLTSDWCGRRQHISAVPLRFRRANMTGMSQDVSMTGQCHGVKLSQQTNLNKTVLSNLSEWNAWKQTDSGRIQCNLHSWLLESHLNRTIDDVLSRHSGLSWSDQERWRRRMTHILVSLQAFVHTFPFAGTNIISKYFYMERWAIVEMSYCDLQRRQVSHWLIPHEFAPSQNWPCSTLSSFVTSLAAILAVWFWDDNNSKWGMISTS
jgi:hypothetical protein